MALDPRLASVELLALAAMRAKERQVTAPGREVVLRVVYEGTPWGDPPEEGPEYVYYVPEPRGGAG